jgi:hypothetical protein
LSEDVEVVDWASPEQKYFFERGPAPTLASGGFGAGKTRAALLKILYLMDKFPGYRAVVVRKRYNELWKTTLPTLFKLLPPSAYSKGSLNKQDGVLELNNGSRFYFLYLEKPEVATVLRGLEINAAVVDQAEEISEEIYDILETRLNRWEKVKINKKIVNDYEKNGKEWPWRNDAGTILPPAYMVLTCNPDIELHWLWRRFHPNSPEWRSKYRALGYEMITFNSLNNKFLSRQNKESLMSKGKDFVDRYVLGKWGRPEGTLFFVDESSILEPTPDLIEKLTKTCAMYRVLDHGYSAPTCCLWFAVDQSGNSYCLREYYHISDQIRVHRENITNMSDGERYRSSLADPAIFQMMPMRSGGRYSVHSEYIDNKIYPKETAIHWSPADNAEMASRLRLKEYLWVDPNRIHPVRGTKGAARLYFLKKTLDYPNGCDNIIKETNSAKLTRVGMIDGRPMFNDDRDPTIPDHALDCLRYHIMARPGVMGTSFKPPSVQSFEGYSRLTKDLRRRDEALGRLDK